MTHTAREFELTSKMIQKAQQTLSEAQDALNDGMPKQAKYLILRAIREAKTAEIGV